MTGKHQSGAVTTDLSQLLRELTGIRDDVSQAPARLATTLANIHPHYQASARNLLHYLALRRHDLRPLQRTLAGVGLSSLGRAESHVLGTLDAVITLLQKLTGETREIQAADFAVDYRTGQQLLTEHSNLLLGPAPENRNVRIMVTMPSEAADDYQIILQLLGQGMDCMRINCAHDEPDAWARMIAHLRRAETELGRSCRVAMDLAGPKLRTGPILPGSTVIKVKPRRDPYGRVLTPARIWMRPDPEQALPDSVDIALTVPDTWLPRLTIGDRLDFTDARDARRTMVVRETGQAGVLLELYKTAYLVPGTVLLHQGSSNCADLELGMHSFPPREAVIRLQVGDRLRLTREPAPGHPAEYDRNGRLRRHATIGCTIPDVFDDIRPGESIWFDDGKIGGIIEGLEPDHALIRITHAGLQGARLRSDKGINLPDSRLRLTALTDDDCASLDFIVRHADIVQMSFANSVRDIDQLRQQLAQRCPEGSGPAIVLKIETRRGFENLPGMLLAAMRAPCVGVMIARGDLAVECGFERLAELQEEILWICEAAHVPVIWATQVLETLAKSGLPSRAEITDAAMGERAECIMLNKGPHIITAVRMLDDILRRMQAHQSKKRSMLRALRLAHTPMDISGGNPAG